MDEKEIYLQQKYVYEGFCEFLRWQIDSMCKENKIELSFPIECRVKSWESIQKKLTMHENLNWKELNDIAGIRVVTVFHEDVERLEKILRDQYEVIKEEDKMSEQSESEFGYQSLHMDIMLKSELEQTAGIKPYVGLQAEIQVRTAAQHIWAVASHELQYKTEDSTPKSLRRAVNRLSALLELVDAEFSRLKEEKKTYVEKIKNDGKEEQTINATTLELILDKFYPKENKKNDEPYSEVVEQLKALKITNSEELRKIISETMDKVMQRDKKMGKGRRFFAHVGLLRNAICIKYPDVTFEFNRVIRDGTIVWTR